MIPPNLSRKEMINAVYYFSDKQEVRMVHYNPEKGNDPIVWQEDYLQDSEQPKTTTGFAVINWFLEDKEKEEGEVQMQE